MMKIALGLLFVILVPTLSSVADDLSQINEELRTEVRKALNDAKSNRKNLVAFQIFCDSGEAYSKTLSASERSQFEGHCKEVAGYRKETAVFLNSIKSSPTIEKITKGIPLPKGSGASAPFHFFNLSAGTGCTQEKFDEMVDKLGKDFLVKHLRDTLILSGLYDDYYRPNFCSGLLEAPLLREKRFAKARYWISAQCPKDAAVIKGQVAKEIARHESSLSSKLRSVNNARTWVLDKTFQHPDCLAGFSTRVMGFQREKLTYLRGNYIFKELSQMKNKRPLPMNVTDWVKPVPGDVVLETLEDGWDKSFLLIENGDQIELRSSGPDLLDSTKDDILIGTTKWK